jgi:hypothetical protein
VTETENVERKRTIDLDERSDCLALVREVVAMANTSGGQIIIGVDDDGAVVGMQESSASKFDPARLSDVLDPFTSPDHVEVTVSIERTDHAVIVRVDVPEHSDPPLVLARDGNYQRPGRAQKSAFKAGDVLVRRGTKVERAVRADYQRWLRQAADDARSLLVDRVALIANLPDNASLQVVTDEDSMDEPTALISRSVRAWSRDPAKLLSATELAYLLLSAQSLTLDDDGQALVLHSALRKKSTLWHWLAAMQPQTEVLRRVFLEAVLGQDRDKSDAGRSMVEVAALTLEASDYRTLIETLADSRYAHLREAAEDGSDVKTVRSRLQITRSQLVGGVDLRDIRTEDLWSESYDLAGILMHGGRHPSASRRLGRLGLELFARTPLGLNLDP